MNAGLSSAIQQPWNVIDSIVNRWHLWKLQRARAVCESYAVRHLDLECEAKALIRSGNYRAAVFTARLQLELAINEVAGRSSDRMRAQLVAARLAEQGVITQRQANWVDRLYDRASRICHGAPVSRGRANSIVGEVRALVHAVSARIG